MSDPLSAKAQKEKSARTIATDSRGPKGAEDFEEMAVSLRNILFASQLTAASAANGRNDPVIAAVNGCATRNNCFDRLPAAQVSALRTGANLWHIFPELSISRIAPYN